MKMKNLIKGEMLKCRMVLSIIIGVVISVLLFIYIKVQIVDRTADYVDVPLDAYAFSTLCNVYLFFILPCMVLLFNLYYSQVEEGYNGWIVVLSSVRKTERIFRVKFLMNSLFCLASYISFICTCCCFLHGRGAEVLFTVVVLPMLRLL